jgi:hypothetical protein
MFVDSISGGYVSLKFTVDGASMLLLYVGVDTKLQCKFTM